MNWKRLSTKILLQHPRLTVAEDEVKLPDGHIAKYIYFKDSHDAAMVIATRGNSILIQTEYSYPPDQLMYQLPGGALEAGENPIEGALRELEEESGYITGTDTTVKYLGYFYTNNRRSAAKTHVIRVNNPHETGKTSFDPEEYIESEWIAINTLQDMICNGKIVNYTILAGLCLFDVAN